MANVTFFFNETSTAGAIISGLTTDVTGSLFLTMLLVYFVVIGFTMAFKMELEVSAILLVPLTLLLMGFSGEFLALGVLLLLYLGGIMAKNFWFTK